jgi:hypothetical protein
MLSHRHEEGINKPELGSQSQEGLRELHFERCHVSH